ncbi:Protein X92 [Trypanosoma conorhini]|uniref:Protein X92 n=1 Tax=Trypanosoma conorhini TaxID=83891 RepID=A0A3R7PMG8_9TRYP|nr:Protein X92 [Trypanosoma conorhini]RNF27608.1 Protein X92 [Trypanosoma conorhini]
MDILRRLLAVQFWRLSELVDEEGTPLLLSWQSLRFQLTLTLSNENGERNRDGAALMAALGESDFCLLWRKLFRTLRILPVVVGAAAAPSSPGRTQGQAAPASYGPQHGVGCCFRGGVPPFWEERTRVEAAPNAQAAASNVMATAGRILTVAAEPRDEVEVEVPRAAVVEAGASEGKPQGAMPRHLSYTYTFSYALPEVEETHRPMTLGFVLLLPFSSGGVDKWGAGDAGDDVMLRALLSVQEQKMGWYRPSFVVLGTCYYQARVGQLLCCSSVARRVSQYRALVNVNVVNIAGFPLRVRQVAFDISSTWVGESLGSLSSVPLWSEQRAGPRSADLKYVELLRRAVTVTPVAVHEFRVPVVLEPEESMNFQFAIQLRPHLCYLLEPHSLGSVYGKFLKGHAKEVADEERSTVLVPPRGSAPVPSKRGTAASAPSGLWRPGAVATGAADGVSREELIQLMSMSFTSHVYVHYEAVSPTSNVCGAAAKGGVHDGEGIYPSLQLRHAVHWSMCLP